MIAAVAPLTPVKLTDFSEVTAVLVSVTVATPPPVMLTEAIALPVALVVPEPAVIAIALPPEVSAVAVPATVRFTSVVLDAITMELSVPAALRVAEVSPVNPVRLRPVFAPTSNEPFVVTSMFSTFLMVAPLKEKFPPAAVAASAIFKVSVPAPPSITSSPPRTRAVAPLASEPEIVSFPPRPVTLSTPVVVVLVLL